ncbi:hypothetical protein [Methylobacterium durans]|uniref:hypothetical protein n=1 Tax=Methylobacterium durans TaxID=2202825 RepID=UPI0013A54C27|nr:hypothetical protein [Methylobacterium durans]
MLKVSEGGASADRPTLSAKQTPASQPLTFQNPRIDRPARQRDSGPRRHAFAARCSRSLSDRSRDLHKDDALEDKYSEQKMPNDSRQTYEDETVRKYAAIDNIFVPLSLVARAVKKQDPVKAIVEELLHHSFGGEQSTRNATEFLLAVGFSEMESDREVQTQIKVTWDDSSAPF